MPTCALITCPGAFEIGDVDTPGLPTALAAHGIRAQILNWAEATNLDAFDAVILRSPWDYPDHPEQFTHWLDAVSPPLYNDRALIDWNLNKRYLLELADQGVPVVPTVVATSLAAVQEAIASTHEQTPGGTGQVVIKPTVSNGSLLTGRFAAGDPRAAELGAQILSVGKEVMVQPAVPSVAQRGETALIYLNGVFSHAIGKGPLLAEGGGLLTPTYTESIQALPASTEQLRVAQAVLDALPGGPAPLYARIDLVEYQGAELLLEAELLEPSLFLGYRDGGLEAMAAAIAQRLA